MPRPALNIKRDCTHGGRHRHGTTAAYSEDRCRCRPCSLRYQAVQKEWKAEPGTVPAAPARAHIRRLMRQGMTYRLIADRAGVSHATICRLLKPKRNQRMKRFAADAILGVQFTPPTPYLVDATGTRRRLQGLACRGFSIAYQAREMGVTRGIVHRHYLNSTRVTAETAARVKALDDRLWDQLPPERTRGEKTAASKTRRYAARNGWLPRLAWDDETIDDPAAKPQHNIRGARELAECGTLAAYRRHLRHNEQPCEPCNGANRRGENAA